MPLIYVEDYAITPPGQLVQMQPIMNILIVV